MGIDRMCMFMSGQDNIKEVLLFPAMKPLEDNNDHLHVAQGPVKDAKDADSEARVAFSKALDAVHAAVHGTKGMWADVIRYGKVSSATSTNYFMKVRFEGEQERIVHLRIAVSASGHHTVKG